MAYLKDTTVTNLAVTGNVYLAHVDSEGTGLGEKQALCTVYTGTSPIDDDNTTATASLVLYYGGSGSLRIWTA